MQMVLGECERQAKIFLPLSQSYLRCGTMGGVMSPPPTRIYAVLGFGLVAVSLAAIFIRLAAAPSVVVAAYRMSLASLVLLPWSLPALRRAEFTRRNVLYAVSAGLFLGLHFITWISSLSYTSVAASVSLVASQPLWVALLGWLFVGLAPSFLTLLGVLTAVAGGALIGFGDFGSGSAPLLGDALAVVGAAAGAVYFLLGRAAQRHGLSLNAYIGLAYGVAALVLLPLPLLAQVPYGGYSPATLLWIGLLALLPQLVGHTSINYALKHLSPTLVATAALLEPVGTVLLAVLLFAEFPSLTTVVGAAVLLTGVALTVQGSRSSRTPDSASS